MKKIILVFYLVVFSLSALSAVGDLYYCEMTQAVEIKEGRLIKYIPQKFKFRISRRVILSNLAKMQTISMDLN